jgi:hypothetical protein
VFTGASFFVSLVRAPFSGFSSFIIFSLNSDICQGSSAVVTASSALEKVKRADWRLTDNAAGCLAQNLQWRQPATKKAVPTNIAPMPPTNATQLPPEKLFRST